MKKLLSIFRKKTYCIKVFGRSQRVDLEITVNEWIKEKKVIPVNVSYTFDTVIDLHRCCILYKF